MKRDHELLDLLRVPEAEQALVLEKLDHAGQTQAWVEVRQNRRHRYSVRDGILLRPSGSRVDFRVRPRNISIHGISVLHGAFLYADTQCELALRTRTGESVLVGAKVLRCRCVQGRIHELRLAFTQAIEIEKFVVVDSCALVVPPPDAMARAAQPPADRAGTLVQRIEQLLATEAQRAELVSALHECVTALRGPSK